jgi:3',5'-cyclic AMP phosphodiesterase CpdA
MLQPMDAHPRMTETITIAHLSDVHLSPLTGFTPRHWNAKRALGFVNWHRKRRHIHLRSVADRLIADMKAQAPDHIALTGDLINIGLPVEYEAAAKWLTTVGPPSGLSVVPGNHDIYTHLRSDPGVGRWNTYMASDEWGLSQGGSATGGFPYVRRVGPIAIVGLCSAVPTAPGIAIGRLGQSQLAEAKQLLERLGRAGLFRLVMIHHPPLPGQARASHNLIDASDMAEILAGAGAELVLHGHNHRPMAASVAFTGGIAHVIGVASASANRAHGEEPLARYNLITITGSPGKWRIGLRQRGLTGDGGGIGELENRTLDQRPG